MSYFGWRDEEFEDEFGIYEDYESDAAYKEEHPRIEDLDRGIESCMRMVTRPEWPADHCNSEVF